MEFHRSRKPDTWLSPKRVFPTDKVGFGRPDRIGTRRQRSSLGIDMVCRMSREILRRDAPQDRNSLSDSWLTITGHPLPCFSKVFILKGVKVLCFDTLLEVLILKGVKKD
jgi:hypothetical protein